MGLTVCRTWAFNDGHGHNALQISPGVFNERVFRVRLFFSLSCLSVIDTYIHTLLVVLFKFSYVAWLVPQGLDYVIVEARKQRIRLILSLVNNLHNFGGKAQYLRWAQEAGINVSSSTDSFFSHPIIKDYYKAYIKVPSFPCHALLMLFKALYHEDKCTTVN